MKNIISYSLESDKIILDIQELIKVIDFLSNFQKNIYKKQLLKHHKVVIDLFNVERDNSMTQKEFQTIVINELKGINIRLEKIENDVADLKQRVTVIEERLDKIEDRLDRNNIF
ncbi:hypothetical protein [Mesoplasma photuris]|uniref:hypothetical protein n=1 Tax=Mesoplasma photuris TaxID=217731 RepID=UPI0004E1E6DA|nr:hypothetical protein [Mesoplasma photuris]